ncbi:CPBP family intramembrane glutamic endopeptidase [Natronosalvus rutilus]|uniref:CPBP family intramembrane metalloprotease n=1 Tax=Natronosalvus rutilus TaxID=2953753 RepID=A0A9E7NDR8_9EURY|nr:CPBP family intramembrane glutamic endopeptidase [Natronosalvus rutilus]UTF55636.1 CPBP family intramembrane metalloprotease [Natronosalvus rutilus]
MIRALIWRHQLVMFVLVAFGWTWTWDAIYYLLGWWEILPVTFPRQWGLPIAAVIVLWAGDGSLQTWSERTLDWRVHPGLYLVALLVPFVITNVQQVVRALGGGTLAYAPPASLLAIALFLLANVVLFGGVEELGWRGFLQPRLQERTSVLTAGLGIGVLWWAWHFPLFFSGKAAYSLDLVSLLTYTTFIVGAATVLGAFVNVTGGRVLPVMLMHATVNVGALLEGDGGLLAGSQLVPLVVGSGLWWLTIAVLVLRYGRTMVPKSSVEPVS